MFRDIVRSLVMLILISILINPSVFAAGSLEIVIDKHEVSAGLYYYDILIGANKDGAVSCELVTPAGTFSMIDIGGEFYPEPGYNDDHTDMDYIELIGVISGDWTITWDAGGPSQTIATITFGAVPEGDFLPVPILIYPIDGEPIEIPGDPNPPTIEWYYEGISNPCNAQTDAIEVFLWDYGSTVISSDELLCSLISWTPPSPLAEGAWIVEVQNSISDYRLVPDGITIVEGTWDIENEDWLALQSIDISRNEVVATESSSWGAIKAQYCK
jgi:hypothetical protein